MIQLFAYDATGVRWELDLYEEEPIKINLSAEDIIEIPRIDAEFSRQFRIPATQKNSQVFKWWYLAGALDFDVTQKVKSELHVDGLLYRQGQLRLQGVYLNGQQDRIDIEVAFLGPTKDFSSEIGEGPMTDINLAELGHDLSIPNIQNSWLPFGHPSLFKAGAIRYIVAERGYIYDSAGVEQPVPGAANASEISYKTGHPQSFQKNSHPLPLQQFTPIVQVKYLIDKLFAETSYTYSTDSIFNESWFKYLYTDGIPDDKPYIEGVPSIFSARVPNSYAFPIGVEERIKFSDETNDPSGSYEPSTFVYTVPINGYYEFGGYVGVADTTNTVGAAGTYGVRVRVNGVEVFANSQTPSTPGTPFYPFTLIIGFAYAATLVQGDVVEVTMETFGPAVSPDVIVGSEFYADVAPTAVSVSGLMKKDLKKIDFFKSVLAKFRCVMVPSKEVENQFIIKPWPEYIGTGDRFDWTDKLDGTKDQKMEPVFFKQSAIINFTDQPDEDHTNIYHQNTFGYTYGRYLLDTQNELLNQTRKVETVFAPTPVDQVEGFPNTSVYIIPKFAQNGTEFAHSGDHLQRLAMVPKPRLLFWNGLATIGIDDAWYYSDGITLVYNTTNYPRASYLSELPAISSTLNLNWAREFAYFDESGTFNGYGGESTYERYWSEYISSLYNPEARLMTAYFVLDSEDIRNLTFDDVIYVKDSWWRLNKIVDAPLGEIQSVKVELIKLLNPIPALIGGTSGDGPLDPDLNLPTE